MPEEIRVNVEAPEHSPRRRRRPTDRGSQPPVMSAHCGAANDGWLARSIRQLQPEMKHCPLRGLLTGPRRLLTQHPACAPDYGHHCCIPVEARSWRRSSCSS
jgi:hypothetical protein